MKYNRTIKIVGITFVLKNNIKLWDKIKLNSTIHLIREETNIYDSNAVMVLFEKTKIGYIPRVENKIISNLLESGRGLHAKVVDKYSTPTERPVIRILIQEID